MEMTTIFLEPPPAVHSKVLFNFRNTEEKLKEGKFDAKPRRIFVIRKHFILFGSVLHEFGWKMDSDGRFENDEFVI